MNVSMSLVDVGILKSIGPDRAKLTNTLRLLGPKYDYLIFGYPPFIRAFVDECDLDLSPYHIDFIVGGEGLSEGLRSHLLQSAKSVVSSYGASDLEINIGVETPLTIALRRLLPCRSSAMQRTFRPGYSADDFPVQRGRLSDRDERRWRTFFSPSLECLPLRLRSVTIRVTQAGYTPSQRW